MKKLILKFEPRLPWDRLSAYELLWFTAGPKLGQYVMYSCRWFHDRLYFFASIRGHVWSADHLSDDPIPVQIPEDIKDQMKKAWNDFELQMLEDPSQAGYAIYLKLDIGRKDTLPTLNWEDIFHCWHTY